MHPQLMPVPFYEDTVVLVGQGNEPLVAMRPIAQNMGLVWAAQYVKIMEKFESTVSEIETVAEDGKLRVMTCLPLHKLPAWLCSISPNKVKPELRDKIIRYQEECDDALWDYWTKGSASRPGSINVNQQLALSRHRVALLKDLHKARDSGLRAALHEQITQISEQLGLSVPALGAALGCIAAAPGLACVVQSLQEARAVACSTLDKPEQSFRRQWHPLLCITRDTGDFQRKSAPSFSSKQTSR